MAVLCSFITITHSVETCNLTQNSPPYCAAHSVLLEGEEGLPHPSQLGGTAIPSQDKGLHPGSSQGGNPHPGQDKGCSHPRSGQVRTGGGGWVLQLEKHSMYLLHEEGLHIISFDKIS